MLKLRIELRLVQPYLWALYSYYILCISIYTYIEQVTNLVVFLNTGASRIVSIVVCKKWSVVVTCRMPPAWEAWAIMMHLTMTTSKTAIITHNTIAAAYACRNDHSGRDNSSRSCRIANKSLNGSKPSNFLGRMWLFCTVLLTCGRS